MFNRLRNISFRNFLMLFSIGAMLILLLPLSSILFFKVKHFIEEKKQFIVSTRMNQIAFEIHSSLSSLHDMLNDLKSNERLVGYVHSLGNSDTNALDKYRLSLDFEKYLHNLRQENAFIDNILVVTPQSQFSSDHAYLDFELNGIQAGGELEQESHFVLPGKASGSIVPPKGAEPSKVYSDAMKALDKRMFFAANIESGDGSDAGVIVIMLDPGYFKEKVPYNESIMLLDANRHLIYSGGPSQAKGTEEHETTIPFNDFRLVYVDQMDLYHEQLVLIIRLTAVTCLLAIAVAFVSSRIISSKVLYPVYKLIKLFRTYDIAKEKLNYYRELQAHNSRFNLRDRFLFYFITTILLPLLVYMAVFYWKSSQIVADDLNKSHYSLFEKTHSLMEHDINQIEVLMARISLDKAVQEDILANHAIKLEQELLNENHFLGLDRNRISIYDPSNTLIFSNRYKQAKEMEPAFFKQLQSSGRVIAYHLRKDDLGSVSIVLGMPMIRLDKYPEVAGYITVELDNRYFAGLYSEFKQNGSEAFIVDRDHRIVSHPVAGQVGQVVEFTASNGILQQEALNGEHYMVSVKSISGIPWKLVSRYNYSDVQKQVVTLFLNDSYLLFLLFLLMLLFAYHMSQRMLKPLGGLNRMLSEYELGESSRMLFDQLSGIDEVDLLGRNFNQMIRRIDDLVHETLVAGQERVKLEYEKKEIQMIALQSQINPHFLYNTLDNLIHLVETKETDKAVDMISSLSRLFRYITNREPMTRVRDEILYAKTYAGIMSHRYDNFRCSWHIDDEALAYGIMKLILQPVIENAIHHGARRTRKQVSIGIWCVREGGAIRLVVKDDAAGMEEEQLAVVRAQLADPEIKKAGIYNVNARIKLNFGDNYGLSIDSKYGEGTTVTILLPAYL
ncbi:sensor histidine kinase [Paenibacillus sp. H1-7]|uniref:cache domain-containing sensor histidine kinase n=1 Tax=Paenibacillus sp. H1-7 TaxID=2282849 RepID=UPI001EF7CBD7|nr:histidine kinase [Paenibacillus sp. H1-7]ULL14956.1 sensor histidine kinase [Paenibacillus sp. H1-7]